jgi:hypothetical protein
VDLYHQGAPVSFASFPGSDRNAPNRLSGGAAAENHLKGTALLKAPGFARGSSRTVFLGYYHRRFRVTSGGMRHAYNSTCLEGLIDHAQGLCRYLCGLPYTGF